MGDKTVSWTQGWDVSELLHVNAYHSEVEFWKAKAFRIYSYDHTLHFDSDSIIQDVRLLSAQSPKS